MKTTEFERRLAALESKVTPELITIKRHITRLTGGIPETVTMTRRIAGPAPGGPR